MKTASCVRNQTKAELLHAKISFSSNSNIKHHFPHVTFSGVWWGEWWTSGLGMLLAAKDYVYDSAPLACLAQRGVCIMVVLPLDH